MAEQNWAVLICGGTNGEFYGDVKRRPWPDMGQQVSFFQALGCVYNALEDRLGAQRIIVVASLNDVVVWLEKCAYRGYPPCDPEHEEQCRSYYSVTGANLESKRKSYQDRLDQLRENCGRILARGGADYDGVLVNPSTVCAVLRGQAVPGNEGKRVLPTTGVKSVFVWVTSHGGHHSVSVGAEPDADNEGLIKPVPKDPEDIVCDICSEPHNELERKYSHGHSSLRTREWFVQFGHRAPDVSIYDSVTTAGSNMDPNSPLDQKSPLCRLYWQQVFQALLAMQVSDPGRRVVMLYQFCTSGGHFKWLDDPLYQKHYQVKEMPVFCIATSKEQQYSLGYTFTGLFLDRLSQAMEAGGQQTLLELYQSTEEQYWQDHSVEKKMNEDNVKLGQTSQCFAEVEHTYGSEVQNDTVADLFTNDLSVRGTDCSKFDVSARLDQKQTDQLAAFYASRNYYHKPSGYKHPPALLRAAPSRRPLSAGRGYFQVHELEVACKARNDNRSTLMSSYDKHYDSTSGTLTQLQMWRRGYDQNRSFKSKAISYNKLR